jgi:hypothetical protein
VLRVEVIGLQRLLVAFTGIVSFKKTPALPETQVYAVTGISEWRRKA